MEAKVQVSPLFVARSPSSEKEIAVSGTAVKRVSWRGCGV